MSSESEGEDSYNLAKQFNEVPQDTDKGVDPQVNVDLKVALEHSLMRCEPDQPDKEPAQTSNKPESQVSILSSKGNILLIASENSFKPCILYYRFKNLKAMKITPHHSARQECKSAVHSPPLIKS